VALTTCPDCGGKVSDSAPTCPHCGRPFSVATTKDELSAKSSALTNLGSAPVHKSKVGRTIAIVLGLPVLFFLVFAIVTSQQPRKAMDVAVSVNRLMVTVTNKGTADVVGKEMDVYINGSPPSGYMATSKVPPVGSSASILLQDFVKDDTRFNSVNQVVSEVWVGAGDYNFTGFDIKR
jgi:hypothetical protein